MKKFFSDDSCYCIATKQVSNKLGKYYDNILKPTGLSISQYSLLKDINTLGESNKSELSRFKNLDRTTIIRNLNKLYQKNLITDIEGETKRNTLIKVTTEGLIKLEEANLLWKDAQNRLQDEIGSKKIKEFMNLLELVNSLEII